MSERMDVITVHGSPLTLVGDGFTMGQPAPDATLLDNNLKPVKLSDFRGKVVVISSVGSLDTSVCDLQTRRFNSEAVSLGDDVVILTVSVDLPFAQKRWCGTAGVERVTTLSDHRDVAFGKAYGLLVKESRMLARAVLVLDRKGIVRYCQLVKELSEEPEYEPVLDAVKALI